MTKRTCALSGLVTGAPGHLSGNGTHLAGLPGDTHRMELAIGALALFVGRHEGCG
ncbi:hypothetical protein GCM10009765_25320 [Fodinicola feengrottensis]|uniref:Uncharacterized protein n=1 Tax=Fodinicola feengrottensis TaxID=435914 RepID=A0ABN2GQ99_9ACTN